MSREELPGDRAYNAAWNGQTEPVAEAIRWVHDNYGVDPGQTFRL